MAGHSKWANTKHRKARADAAKGKIFTKISKEIMVAARFGGGDINNNFRLRLAVQKGREANMPTDNIQRAIQKGAGGLDGVDYEEIIYEGYGPAGVAVLLEILTDNRNRTAGEVRHIFSRHGGSLGESGCVAWMFRRRGYLVLSAEEHDEEQLMLLSLEAGAEDFAAEEDTFEIYTSPEDFEHVKEKMEAEGIKFTTAEVTMIPENYLEISDSDEAGKAMGLMDALLDHDDVQNAYSNFDISSELAGALG
ncbi:MAG: YebC/PmpR family DNA-binding transcriptional regulator [Dethiobacter sp.]|jgi:YebC/PmpR family DNA-binding regulatory protein|nr:YebC/PmpR family DNA-binding transcriptional regulator [Dethiobacter sp.]